MKTSCLVNSFNMLVFIFIKYSRIIKYLLGRMFHRLAATLQGKVVNISSSYGISGNLMKIHNDG